MSPILGQVSVRSRTVASAWPLEHFSHLFLFHTVTIFICVAFDRAPLPPVSTQSLAHRWVLM